jgi:hypothetical protein
MGVIFDILAGLVIVVTWSAVFLCMIGFDGIVDKVTDLFK